LTARDVTSLRAFDAGAQADPRKAYADLALPGIYPSLTDDSLPDFGADLEWTPGHGPTGPPLKPKSVINSGQPSTSQGAADTIDMPVEV
jgi:hypothetical protein